MNPHKLEGHPGQEDIHKMSPISDTNESRPQVAKSKTVSFSGQSDGIIETEQHQPPILFKTIAQENSALKMALEAANAECYVKVNISQPFVHVSK